MPSTTINPLNVIPHEERIMVRRLATILDDAPDRTTVMHVAGPGQKPVRLYKDQKGIIWYCQPGGRAVCKMTVDTIRAL